MTSIQERLEQKIASARALVKVAGEGCCDVEKGKTPESLIGDAADVKVTENLPEGVTVPGSENLDKDGETSEDRGTDVGHVETNGPAPENNVGNAEVAEITSVAEHVSKHASAVVETAQQILKLAESSFSGLGKQASAEPTDADVERYIIKQAAAGNPVMRGMLAYCQMFKEAAEAEEAAMAEGASPDEAAEGADLEAAAAQAQEQVAQELIARTGMSEEEAMQAAGDAVASVLSGEEGGEEEGITEEDALEAAEAVKEELMAAGMGEEEAEGVAIESIAQVLENGGAPADMGDEVAPAAEGELDKSASAAPAPQAAEKAADNATETIDKNASAEAPATEEAGVEKQASAEKQAGVEKQAGAEEELAAAAAPEEGAAAEAVPAAEAAPAVEDAAAAAEGGVSGEDAEVLEMVGQMVEDLAAQIQQEDPGIGEEEALDAAADQVADALETVEAQQAIGATDESGAPVVSDEDAAAAVDELEKSASAYPLRGLLATGINTYLGLDPSAFAARLNIQ